MSIANKIWERFKTLHKNISGCSDCYICSAHCLKHERQRTDKIKFELLWRSNNTSSGMTVEIEDKQLDLLIDLIGGVEEIENGALKDIGYLRVSDYYTKDKLRAIITTRTAFDNLINKIKSLGLNVSRESKPG